MTTSPGNRLRIFRKESPVTVLGPGRRAVVWLQGCDLECRGCLVPESWDASGGLDVSVDEVGEWIIAQEDIEGVTFSGGEPMRQAGALAALVGRIRASRDLGVMVYTGLTYERLAQRGTEPQRRLLAAVDLLVDGAYLQERASDSLWRGSSNQRLLCLTPRYRSLVASLPDRCAGMQVFANASGGLAYVGVPTRPGFREAYRRKMAEFGLKIENRGGGAEETLS